MIHKMDFAKFQAQKKKKQSRLKEIACELTTYTMWAAFVWYFLIRLSDSI